MNVEFIDGYRKAIFDLITYKNKRVIRRCENIADPMMDKIGVRAIELAIKNLSEKIKEIAETQ